MSRHSVDKLMEQIQTFASAWALVGSRFDSGDMFEEVEKERAALRGMLLRFQQWPAPRPMSEAPKDKPVLAWWPSLRMWAPSWVDPEFGWVPPSSAATDQPTCWHPMPPAPADQPENPT